MGMNATDFLDKDGNLLYHIDDGSNAVFKLTGDNRAEEYFAFEGYNETKGGNNEVNFGSAIAGAQEYVLDTFKSTKNANGNWDTYCNQGAMTVARTAIEAADAMGMSLPNAELVNGLAREILSNLSSLTPVSLESAKEQASSGSLIVGGWSGHVFTMRADGRLNNVGSLSAAPNNNLINTNHYFPSGTVLYSFAPVPNPTSTYGIVNLPSVSVSGSAPVGWSGGYMQSLPFRPLGR